MRAGAATALAPAGRPAAPKPAALAVLVGAVGAATAAGAILANGALGVTLAPILLVTAVYLMFKVPLRLSASGLLLLLLILDDTVETTKQWRTPFAILGSMLHFRLHTVAGIPGLAVTGMELVLAVLFGVWLQRKVTGSRLDAAGQVPSASLLRAFLLLYVAGVLFTLLVGMARGLPVAPWKLRNLLHPVVLCLLFLAAYRGPRDHLLLGRLVVFSACVRAILALVVQRIAVVETGGHYDYATSHGDSILFAVAGLIVVADLLERPDRGRLLRAALIVPIIVVGAIQNERRLVWVMVEISFLFVYLLGPLKAWRRSLTKMLVVSLPIIALYVGVGWNRGGTFFAPIQNLRSVSDTSADRSAYWREVENWNIAMSLRERPLLGTGLGGEYTEYMANDDVSRFYKEYREWPHNTFLGLLLTMGFFGFTTTFALPAAVLFLAIRSYRAAATPDQRVAALACVAAVTACQVMAWGDLGSHFPQYKVFLGLAIAVSAKLAVATGAWPAPIRRAA